MFAYALLKSLCFFSLSPSFPLSLCWFRAARPHWQQQDCGNEGGHIQLKQGMDCCACVKLTCLLTHLVFQNLSACGVCVCLHTNSLSMAWIAGADYGPISEETWQYLLSIYGGGPEIAVRQTISPPDTDTHGERKIEAETRALWNGEIHRITTKVFKHYAILVCMHVLCALLSKSLGTVIFYFFYSANIDTCINLLTWHL